MARVAKSDTKRASTLKEGTAVGNDDDYEAQLLRREEGNFPRYSSCFAEADLQN